MKAQLLGYKYLQQSALKGENDLTHSNFKQPLLVEGLKAMQETSG